MARAEPACIPPATHHGTYYRAGITPMAPGASPKTQVDPLPLSRLTCNCANELANEALTEGTSSEGSFSHKRAAARLDASTDRELVFLGDEMPSLQWSLVIVRVFVLAPR